MLSVAVDVPTNRVVVATQRGSTDVANSLRAAYGDAVVVTYLDHAPMPMTCSPFNCPNPLKGGLSITGGGYICTSGYFQKVGSVLYMITGGHCLDDAGGVGVPWYHTSLIGYAAHYQSAGTADAGLITSSEGGARNQVLEYVASPPPWYTILSLTGWTAGSSQTLGSLVCKAGQTTGWTCGTLTQKDVTVGNRYHLNVTTATTSGGDSGGSVIGPSTKLYGETSLGDSGHDYYVTPDRVNSFFGGSPCVTASC